jgi:hypothetical protein
MSTKRARKILAVVWFAGSGPLFLLLVLQSLLGRFSPSERDEVWSLFLPAVVPTLTLMIGVLVSDALGKSQSHEVVGRFIFSLTLSLSIIYLVIIGLPLFLAPFSDEAPIALLRASQLWVLPLQGLVSAALGAFFVHKPSPVQGNG